MRRITLTDEQLDEVQRISGVADIRRSYSGRLMRGTTCVGVVGQANDFMRFCLAVASTVGDPTLAVALGDAARQDDMALNKIWYWWEIVREGDEGVPLGEDDDEWVPTPRSS